MSDEELQNSEDEVEDVDPKGVGAVDDDLLDDDEELSPEGWEGESEDE